MSPNVYAVEMGNFAFIDSQNVNLGIRSQGWSLDFHRFRIYLKEKYAVNTAYLFLGYVAGNTHLYQILQEAGYICIFKPTLVHKDGTIKGNCDAELVLQAMIDFSSYEKAVIVTGDGDFYCLVNYLISRNKLKALMIPNQYKFSALLKAKALFPFTRYMNDLKRILKYKKERPQKDGTLRGDLSRS